MSDKLKCRIVNAEQLRVGDIFIRDNGNLAKALIVGRPSYKGEITLTAIDMTCDSIRLYFDRKENVTLVTDNRVYQYLEV